ncbi:hypothetical protein M407DRAFT_52328, partial [Tulasnella calospora MUT 4182]
LVPVRLEIEYESYRFRDTLVWNVNDPVVTVERFAQLTVEDFQLPAPMASLIAKQIQEQLTEHKAVDLPDAMNIVVDREEILQGKLEEDGDDLDIVIGSRHLTDQFEWDIMETTNSPELFADSYASELGLGGEFKSAIAHDIREQVNMYQRALVAIGHNFDGGTIFDDDLRQAILPPVSIAGRTADQAANCMPILNNLSEGEMESNEKEREKELKRKKRQGRAR